MRIEIHEERKLLKILVRIADEMDEKIYKELTENDIN